MVYQVDIYIFFLSELWKQTQIHVRIVRACGMAAAAHIYLAAIVEPS